MKPLLAFLLLSLAVTPALAVGPDPVRTAVVKGLRRIEQGSANYLKNRKCFSCHHQAVTIHCLAAARKRGLEVDPAKLRQQVDFTLNTFKHKREQVAQGKAVPGGNTMAAYALFALEAGGHAPDETTKALVEYLLVKQKPDGSWTAVMQRQPSEGSPFTNAAFALRALRTCRTAELQDRVDKAFVRGRDWLLNAKPKDTEDRAFRLRGLVNAGADPKQIDAARAALLKEQLADGSWKQLPDRSGDAYATATVLMALRHAGLPAKDAAFRRGIKYLLGTQREDGAWIVETRSRPVQTFFDNGDPGDKSQFISFLSTCWAVAALLETMPVDAPKPGARKPFVPTEQYAKREIEGWTVHVNKHLLAGQTELGKRALRLLEVKLYDIKRAVPAKAVAELQKVSIWLGVNDGNAPCAEYHPSKDWLIQNGYNPDKARAVEIGNAKNFVEWSMDQPSMILHELAHAYHDRVLGFDRADIKAAYQNAVDGKLYERVLHIRGKHERAYAITNHHEYFAEATEAYFGTNDFFPFVRAELKKHDPRMYELLQKVWGR